MSSWFGCFELVGAPRCTLELGSARGELRNDGSSEQQASRGATGMREGDCSEQGGASWVFSPTSRSTMVQA